MCVCSYDNCHGDHTCKDKAAGVDRRLNSWNDYIRFMEDTSPWKLLDLVMTKTHWIFKRLVTGKLMDVGHESLCFDVDNHPEHM